MLGGVSVFRYLMPNSIQETGMNTLRRTQSDSLSITNRLAHKLHPYRHPEVSGLMSAIVGFVIEAPFGAPRIVEIIPKRELWFCSANEYRVSQSAASLE
jgi:hypothetical protein